MAASAAPIKGKGMARRTSRPYVGRMDLLDTMEAKLRAAFAPRELRVEDESHQHAGHGGAAEHAREHGASAPSHAHILIRADALADLSRLARHRAVMDAIAEEVAQLHALRISVLTD